MVNSQVINDAVKRSITNFVAANTAKTAATRLNPTAFAVVYTVNVEYPFSAVRNQSHVIPGTRQ